MDVLPFIDGRISYLNKIALYEREKPYISSVPFLLTEGKNANIDETKHDVKIFDVRGNEDDFKLPVHGFQYIKHQFSSKPDGKIDGPNHPYLEEVREILKAILQPKLVIFYDCNVSSSMLPNVVNVRFNQVQGTADWRPRLFSASHISAYR